MPNLERPHEPEGPVSPRANLKERPEETAALILEVLAGERSSGEAAEALGVSLTRYYVIERRAITGLVTACRAQSLGPRRDPEREIQKLRYEVARLERECRRSQSLLRISQRTSTLQGVLEGRDRGASKSEKKRRRRQKATRALVLAQALREREKKKTVEPRGRPGKNEKEDSQQGA